MISKTAIFIFLIFFLESAFAQWLPERRRDQFPKQEAYLAIPLPYSYTGIGDGLFLIGNVSNLLSTTTDIYFAEATGDASGQIGQISELPLISKQLFLSLQFQDISRGLVNNYNTRGMINSNGDNFSLLDLTKANLNTLRLDYSFDKRRYNIYLQQMKEEYDLDAIRDTNGNLITQLVAPFTYQYDSNIFGISVDLTDDNLDPKSGLRFHFEFTDRPAKTSNDPDYYNTNFSFLYYQPLKELDTFVFNYYQSDAHVRSIGNNNANDIKTELGFNCGTNTSCLQAEQALIDNFVAARTYGTADTLGGLERLRSYPSQRFQGSHIGFIGTEYRWNLATEATPFNYFLWKDVRTAKQIAFFFEAGSVSEQSSKLWQEQRYTYGAGFRLQTASGNIYRADLANGDEGFEMVISLFYPWR